MNEDTIEHLLGLFNMVESKRSPEMLPDFGYPFYNQEPIEIKEENENWIVFWKRIEQQSFLPKKSLNFILLVFLADPAMWNMFSDSIAGFCVH